jgi:hypothetical protein
MIGKSLVALLLGTPAITSLIGDRLTAASFEVGDYPCMFYNTDGIKSLPCRGSKNIKTGQLEVGIMARSMASLEDVASEVTTLLEHYDGVVEGIALVVDEAEPDFDDEVPDLGTYTRVIRFDVTCSKQF